MAEMEEKKTVGETADQEEKAVSPETEESTEAAETDSNKDSEDGGASQEEAGKTEETKEDASSEQAAGKKTFFDKLKKKDKKDPKGQQIEDLTDRVKRSMAEFDNFRKRTEKEKAAMFDMGARSVVEKILPIVDNFERGLATVPDDKKEDSFVDGMDKVYKQLVKTLTDMGVEPIEAVGKEFDPNLHNAVMHVEDEAYGENEVAAEFQKGYTYKGTVVRHSMVQVAN